MYFRGWIVSHNRPPVPGLGTDDHLYSIYPTRSKRTASDGGHTTNGGSEDGRKCDWERAAADTMAMAMGRPMDFPSCSSGLMMIKLSPVNCLRYRISVTETGRVVCCAGAPASHLSSECSDAVTAVNRLSTMRNNFSVIQIGDCSLITVMRERQPRNRDFMLYGARHLVATTFGQWPIWVREILKSQNQRISRFRGSEKKEYVPYMASGQITSGQTFISHDPKRIRQIPLDKMLALRNGVDSSKNIGFSDSHGRAISGVPKWW